MYRLLESIPASPKNSRTRQEKPPLSGPSKGGTGQEACSRRGGYNHRPHTLGRPVTSAGQRNATPLGVALVAYGAGLRRSDLQARPLGCSIRLAYQAADASHPRAIFEMLERAERARRGARKLRRTGFIFHQGIRGGISHRKGITRGKHRPHRTNSSAHECIAREFMRRSATPERILLWSGRQQRAIPPGMAATSSERSFNSCRDSSSEQIAGRGVSCS
jgi:hypothetical protein